MEQHMEQAAHGASSTWSKQHMESPIAPPRTLCGQGPSTLAQLQLIRPHVEVVAHRAAMGAKQTTGTPLRERVGDLQVAHGPAPGP